MDTTNTATAAAPKAKPYTPIPLTPVQSNQIGAIGYDAATQTLAVCFARGAGAIYHYPGVSPELHAEFMAADSKGIFFGQRIRPLPFEKFTPSADAPGK
ncbi:KTSC domain-containing protein [Acidovorax sp. LjRoot74]|uniref:KTSC domain-containing protein n=1 Tax=Acidovorax sp. LjRoot74 TaxID=3342337 RepID=UPI003ECE471D